MKTLAMRFISKLIVTIGILLLISGSTVSYVRPIRSSWTVKQNNQFSSEFSSYRNIHAESVRSIQSIRQSSRGSEGFNSDENSEERSVQNPSSTSSSSDRSAVEPVKRRLNLDELSETDVIRGRIVSVKQ